MDHSPESPWQQEKTTNKGRVLYKQDWDCLWDHGILHTKHFFILIIEIPIIILPINIRQNDQKGLILTILVG